MTLREKARARRLAALRHAGEVKNIFEPTTCRQQRPVLRLVASCGRDFQPRDFDPDQGMRLAA